MDHYRFLVVILGVPLFSLVLNLFLKIVWRPYILTKCFESQGIRGPKYSFIFGSLEEIKKLMNSARKEILNNYSHDITPRVLPHYQLWSSTYGETFYYWHGTQLRLCIQDPELVKQILSNKFGFYTKGKARPTVKALLGKGLVLATGLDWVNHRRIINPAFNVNRLKMMTKMMISCIESRLQRWQNRVTQSEGDCTEIEVNGDFQKLTADIIAHTAFGSSYMEGKVVFKVQKELQTWASASSSDIFIPGSQYLPTRRNYQVWKLERKVRNKLQGIIEKRLISKKKRDCDSGIDLLGLMLGSETEESERKQNLLLNIDEIIDECKTFFFAGHETTSTLLTWTIYLLSLYPEWQEKLRKEVMTECGKEIRDADSLNKLKLVQMVLLEVLRLYCPVIRIFRNASKDMKLGDLMIPKNTVLSIPFPMIHMSKTYWGKDANKFNPMRFSEGVTMAARHPNALIPFSIGPRACIGKNFAMLEAKLVISMILPKFSFSLSPNYKHAPIDNLSLHPQFGLHVLIKPLTV